MLHQFLEIRKWVSVVTIIIIFTFAVSIFFHKDSAITQDLGRHLTFGKIIWEQKSIPTTNLFSYTNPSFPAIDHHWGSQVIFYLVERFFSIDGLIILKIIITVSAFGLLVFYSLHRAQPVATLLASFFVLEILRERTEVRPEIFAYFLFSVFLIILYKEKENRGRLIWILPILSLIWVNLHITFIFSIAIYFLFIFDRMISGKFQKKYLIIGMLLIASTIINLFGLKGVFYPLKIFDNYGYPIVENQSPFFLEKLMNNPTISYFKIAAVAIFLSAPFLFVNKYFFEIAAVVLTGILSMSAIRNFPFFALSAVVPLSASFLLMQRVIAKFINKKDYYLVKSAIYLLFLIFIVWETYLLFSNKYYINHRSDLRAGFGQVNGLQKTVNFWEKYKLGGPIFNNFDIGSYLIYRLYPEESVFVDSRPEAYPASFFQNIYIPMQEDETIWKQTDDYYHFRTIIFGHTDATPWAKKFLGRILKDDHWVLVYFDDYGVILVRTSLFSQSRLMDIKKQLRNYSIALIQENKQPDALYRLASFFRILELYDMENLAATKARSLSI